MAPSPEKQAGKLLGLLAQEGRQYGDLVAERLVELVRAEPLEGRDDLHRQLVAGAATYLCHTAWYARVSAASCLESLARLECGQEEPSRAAMTKEGGGGGDALTDELARGWVGLGDVRLAEVLERGALLLSHGEDADIVDSERATPSADVGTRVGRQRKRLLECLGLAGGSGEARAGSLYSSIGDAIEDEDIEGPAANAKRGSSRGGGRTKLDGPIPTASGTATTVGSGSSGSGSGDSARQQLSARQRNRLAREARSNAAAAAGRSASRGGGGGVKGKRSAGGKDDGDGSGGGDEGGREDGPPAFLGRGARGSMMKDVASNAREALVSLAADLVAQLFHPIWQCRHGAALGALSILRAWNARRRRGEPVPYGARMAALAEDAVARCVCVLALDRFGDYSSRMVAPVRETAAQLLAVAALQLEADKLRQAARLLFELTASGEWQARHGGFCSLESLCAVAITGDGADGRGAPPEVSAFLHGLVYRAAPRGLSDPAEDVCAAAARAVRLVMRRFLPPVEAGRDNNGGEARLTLAPAGRQRRERVPTGDVKGEVEVLRSCGGGGEVFDWVWKALEDLDQDSTCVEDLASLLETCCEDVGRASGATDPFLSSGERRLNRLLDLWEDVRAGVRACAVRSLLALAQEIVGATRPMAKTQSSGGSAAATRCERLLLRCFQALLSERDDGVREHSARLWSELLNGLGRADGHRGAAHASLMASCLGVLFAPPATPPPPTTTMEDVTTADTAESAASSSPASTRPARRPSKRARDETSGSPEDVSAARPPSKHQQRVVQADTIVEGPAGAGASATFFGRLASAGALAELARASAAAAEDGEAAAARGDGASATSKTGSSGRGSSSGKRARAVSDGHGSASDGETEGVVAAEKTARELVMSEVARRAGSGWAWEQELAFFLMEACCAGGGLGARGGSGGGSASTRGDEVLSKAEHDAWAAVDRALATKDDAAAVGHKVFKELEGVDKAVSAACSGVIRVLLQAAGGAATATAGTVEQASPAAGSASSNKGVTTATSSTAAGSQRAKAAARKPSKGGKSRSQGTAKAAAVRGSSARSRSTAPVPPTATPAPLQGAASVERTFQLLAAAFGETLVPVDRGATREEREAVWTGRVRHFHARIQAQQAVLTRRITSAAASVYAGVCPLPPELNPILRPLVSAVKKEPDAQRRGLSASRLARLATALLGDAARSERRDAGAMVLFGLASLSGKGQQQSLIRPATAAAAANEESLMAVEVACDGATEMLRHAVSLAPSSSAVPMAPVLPPASPASAARPLPAPGSSRGDGGCGGGDRGEGREEVVKDGSREGGRGRGGQGGKAVRDWALQTLAPLLRHPSGMGLLGGNTIGTGTTALPRAQRKLSAAEKNKSAAEIRAIDLSAALGVAEALLQAARDRTAAAAAANPDRGARPLLGSLLIETSLASGLLALARSGRAPVSGDDEGADISAKPTRRDIPLRQHYRSGGGAGNYPDGGTPSVDGGGHAAAVAAATADAALIIARDAAALFPDGLWEGLRSDLLPALAAGASSGASSGDVGGSGMSGDSFGDGGGGGIGVAGDVRAGLVLKEVVGGMGIGVVPYAARLLPVALRGMTNANEEVRGLLAGTFNELVKAVALAADDADDDRHAGDHKGGEDLGDGGVSTECTIHGQLQGQGKASAAAAAAAAAAARVGKAAGDSVEEDGELIARHLVRGEPLPRLHRGLLPEALGRKAAAGVTIRPYQWEGIAWLDFLRRIGAHGILADDMGLGKTLQALMAVAMCHHHHPGRRSLVVCPSMLVHHWKAECSRYFGDGLLRPVAYAGPPQARRRLAGRLGLGPAGNDKDRNGTKGGADDSQGSGADGATASAAAEEEEEPERANVVITSYNVLRTDADVLGEQGWLYLVLDEAHLLRNPATRTAKAARALRSNQRVGLTGTPIQNSVLELWSLFEFLMPGYLGDRRSFQRDVARPVRAALSSEGDGRATVEGLQELEKLHRQVLPFVLRREKSEVLADLPSKIITEMVCDLTPEQRRLHNMWERGGDGGRVLAAVAQAEEMEAARLRAVASAAVTDTAAAAAVAATSERSAERTGHFNAPTTVAPTPSQAVTASGSESAAGDGGAASADLRGKNTATEASRAAGRTGRLSVGAQTLTCLSKLQLLCVHPSLVTREEGTKRREMSEDVKLSGKLMALRELLWDAGIGKRQTSMSVSGGGGGGGSGESSSGSESVDIGSSDSDMGTMDDSSSDDNEEEEEEEERAGRAVNDGKRRRSLEQRQSSSDSRKRGRNSRGGPESGGSRAGYTNPSPAHAGPNGSTSSPGKPDTKRSTVGTAGSFARAARSSSSRGPAESTGKGGTPPPTTTVRGKGSLPRQEQATTAGDGVASPLPGCKCLVFAQHKAALDVTESALLRPCFPGVKYLRMDGSVSQAERAAAVDRFSADPSVAILLLTTRVGHLGLNLSAASMVVFLEHDWNPQVDLQAMDRAHRLGQRKAVNVYRLIAAGSVEQRVLRLQGHKLQVAGAVVSRENSSAFSSGTGGVLGMLGEAMAVVAAANKKKDGDGGDGGESVELWSADEDYAYLAAERLADSVARE